jgi:hypothetical protein
MLLNSCILDKCQIAGIYLTASIPTRHCGFCLTNEQRKWWWFWTGIIPIILIPKRFADGGSGIGGFFRGFLFSMLAGLLSAVVISIVTIFVKTSIPKSELWSMVRLNTLILLILWAVMAVIAGVMAVENGNKTARTFIIASFFITTFLFGGCTGLF